MATDSSLRKGQKVRVTYEATYDQRRTDGCYWVDGSTVHPSCLVPSHATIEPIEDLRAGDVVMDADNCFFLRHDETAGKPWRSFGGYEFAEGVARRPFKLHIRAGQPVTP